MGEAPFDFAAIAQQLVSKSGEWILRQLDGT